MIVGFRGGDFGSDKGGVPPNNCSPYL